MKKLSLFTAIAAILSFSSCTKDTQDDVQQIAGCTDETALNYNADATEDDNSCTYSSDLLIGNWEAVSVLEVYEYGTLNPADTTIRIVIEEGSEVSDLPSGTLSLNFTESLVYLSSQGQNVDGDWEYVDDALYITWYMVEDGEEIEVLEILNVDELSSSLMVLRVDYYGSYPEDGEIYYEEYNQLIYFDKADSAQEIIAEVERLIANNKTPISQLIKDLRNR